MCIYVLWRHTKLSNVLKNAVVFIFTYEYVYNNNIAI